MKLKKIYRIVLFTITIIYSNFLYSQEFTSSSKAEFMTYITQQDQYYQNLIDQNNGSTEGVTGYKSYMRWKNSFGELAYNSGGMANVLQDIHDFNSNYSTYIQNIDVEEVAWEELGPENHPLNFRSSSWPSHGPYGVGRIFSVEFDPTDSDRVFVGSPSGGLFYSEDHGETWINGGTDQLPNPGISHMKIIPAESGNPETWIILTGDFDNYWWSGSFSHGIYRSQDQGQTWENVSNGINIESGLRGRKLLLNPNNHDEMYVIMNNGLYKTTNLRAATSSVAWIQVDTLLFDDNHFTDICEKPGTNFQTIYVSTREGIYKTTNGGASFSALPNQTQINFFHSDLEYNRVALRTTPANPNILYAAIIENSNGSTCQIFKYNDITNQWEEKGVQLPNGQIEPIGFGRYQGFAVSPTQENVLYKSRLYYLDKSTDGGETWIHLSRDKHDDTHWICFENGDPDKMWLGTDGGVHFTDNDFSTITDKTKGIGVASIEKITAGLKEPNMYLVGTWDCGSNILLPYKNDWGLIASGDAFKGLFNENDENDLKVHTSAGEIIPIRSTDIEPYFEFERWWEGSNTSRIGSNGFPHRMTNDFTDNGIIYYPGKYRVGRSFDNGVTWEAISTIAGQGIYDENVRYRLIANSKKNRDILYVSKIRQTDPAPEDYHQILKSTNCRASASSVAWQDVTPYLNGNYIREWWGSIAVNENNPNQFWVTRVGYNNLYKVLFYNGSSWSNITSDQNNTLQGLSVTHVEWVDGPDNMLIIGTNCGVYYKTDNMINWTKLQGIPNVKVMDLVVQPEINKFLVATRGRGVWRGSLPCVTPDADENITVNTTWDSDDLKGGNVIVQSGARLTIEDCEIQFAPGKKIIVQQGAELFVDNAILDSRCSELWGGIEVWGNRNLSQSPSTNQGAVRTYTGSVIKNAVCGIRAVKYTDEPILNSAGGIIIANSTQFLNNALGISIPYYNGFSNNSVIANCAFIITDNVSSDIGMPTGIHLVSGTNIAITDNQFLFENTNEELKARSIGIKNTGASVTINKRSIGNHFSGWNYGIYSSGIYGADHVIIRDNTFEECITGVYMSGNASCEIIFNDFDIPQKETEPHFAGVYLNNCNSFTLEENSFHSGYNIISQFNSIGLVINNSGPYINEVYKNTFDQVKYAVLAQAQNRATNGNGLSFKCNTFTSNGFDISVVDEVNYTGIAQYQGSNASAITAPAGNRFSYTGPIGTPTDINNQEQQIIYYYHSDNEDLKLKPKFYINTTPVPNIQTWVYEDCCPSNYSGGGSGGIEEIRALMSGSGQAADSILNIITALQDGGDTDELSADVFASTPPETMLVYNELLGTSPYLSDSVVETAIFKEDVLPNAMIRDVMVANPQSAKNNELMEAVDDRSDAMPMYMKAQILEGKSIITAFEHLKSDYAYNRSQSNKAYQQAKNWYLSDTLNPEQSYDSLLSLLDQRQEVNAKYQLVSYYLQKNDLVEATDQLNEIPNQLELSSYEQAEYNDMQNFYGLLFNMQQNNLIFTELNNEQLSLLEDMELEGNGRVQQYARNIRLKLGLSDYEEPYIIPDLNKSTEIFNFETELLKSIDEVKYLEVFPNPAKDYVILKYLIDNNLASSYLQITNASGKVLQSIEVLGSEDQIVIDTKNYKSGVYIASLFINGEMVESDKFNIIN